MSELTLMDIKKNMLLLNNNTGRVSIVMDYTSTTVEMYNLPVKQGENNSGGNGDLNQRAKSIVDKATEETIEKSHGIASRQWYTLKDLNNQFKRIPPSEYPHENFQEIFEGWKLSQEYTREYLKNNKKVV